MLYIQDDRYFGSLYGLETHDKRQDAEKRIKVGVFKENFALAVRGVNTIYWKFPP